MELKVAKLALTVYTDESFTEIKREVVADRLKIPYRVAIYIGESLDKIDLKSKDAVFNFVTGNLDKLDRIIKATFGLSDADMDCVDATELGAVGVELYKWCMEKLTGLKGDSEKNAVTAAE